MIAKLEEKNKAISLRKKGMSLRDIVKIVPVAKSTVSLWLKEVHLSTPQIQRLTQKKRDAQLRGALRRKTDRIEATKAIHLDAGKDIGEITKKELLLMGTMLYWAEGAKQKEHSVAAAVRFSNSDPIMVRLFVRWLQEVCLIPLDRLRFDVYIHATAKREKEELFRYWSEQIAVPLSLFKGHYLKKGNIKTKRKNIGDAYYGLVSLKVSRSTNLNRKIDGWIRAVGSYYWGMV